MDNHQHQHQHTISIICTHKTILQLVFILFSLGVGASYGDYKDSFFIKDLKRHIVGKWVVGPVGKRATYEFFSDDRTTYKHYNSPTVLHGTWDYVKVGITPVLKISYSPGTSNEYDLEGSLVAGTLHLRSSSHRDRRANKLTENMIFEEKLKVEQEQWLATKKTPEELEEKLNIPEIMAAVKTYFNNDSKFSKKYQLGNIIGIRVDSNRSSLFARVWYTHYYLRNGEVNTARALFNFKIENDKYLVTGLSGSSNFKDDLFASDTSYAKAKKNALLGTDPQRETTIDAISSAIKNYYNNESIYRKKSELLEITSVLFEVKDGILKARTKYQHVNRKKGKQSKGKNSFYIGVNNGEYVVAKNLKKVISKGGKSLPNEIVKLITGI